MIIIKSLYLVLFSLFGINSDQSCNCKYESNYLLLESGVKISYQLLQENIFIKCSVIEDKLFVTETVGNISGSRTFYIYDYTVIDSNISNNGYYSFESTNFIFNQISDFSVCNQLEITINTKSGYIINYALPFEKLNSIEFNKFMQSVQSSSNLYLEEYGTKSDYLKYLYDKNN